MTLSINLGGNGMRYLYRRGAGVNRRVMHIEKFTDTGQQTGEALCGIDFVFDTSINAPFGLGRPICRNCRKPVDL